MMNSDDALLIAVLVFGVIIGLASGGCLFNGLDTIDILGDAICEETYGKNATFDYIDLDDRVRCKVPTASENYDGLTVIKVE